MLNDERLRIWSDITSEIQDAIYENAKEKGWWSKDSNRDIGAIFMNIVSEVAEGWEEYRNNRDFAEIWYNPDSNPPGKPEGIPTELADVIIRILNFAVVYDIDIASAIIEKMAYNKTRPYRHGGKKV